MTFHTFSPSAKNPSLCYECEEPKANHKTFIGKDQEVRIEEMSEDEAGNNLREYWEA